jgi:hypothetical protein
MQRFWRFDPLLARIREMIPWIRIEKIDSEMQIPEIKK